MYQVISCSSATHNLVPEDPSNRICVICSRATAEKIAELLNDDLARSQAQDTDPGRPKSDEISGGSLVLPDGYFVCSVNLDADIPVCSISDKETMTDERDLEIPRSLAYYLTTHHNGSNNFREVLRRDAQNVLRGKLRSLLEHSPKSIER